MVRKRWVAKSILSLTPAAPVREFTFLGITIDYMIVTGTFPELEHQVTWVRCSPRHPESARTVPMFERDLPRTILGKNDMKAMFNFIVTILDTASRYVASE